MKLLKILIDIIALQFAAILVLYPCLIVAKREDERSEKQWGAKSENERILDASDKEQTRN